MKKLVIGMLIISLSALIYSIAIEPFDLESTFHQVKIGTSGKSFLVAHITDLHTDGLEALELKLIETIHSQKPDIILITGDITTPGGTIRGYKEVLSKLKAPLGVFFVQGNWEYWEPLKDLKNVLKESNIYDLTNSSIQIKEDLWLVGFDDELAGAPKLQILESIPKGSKTISIFHSPSLFDSVLNDVDIAFAGHTHGGQIRIPFIGPLWTPQGTGNYISGWFSKGNSKMYVSRGLGNSILPIRFNCKPEVAFIKVTY